MFVWPSRANLKIQASVTELLIETMNSSENGLESCTLHSEDLCKSAWIDSRGHCSFPVFPLIVDKLPQPGFSSAVLWFIFFFKDPDVTVRPTSPRPESIHLDSANTQSSNMFLLDVYLTRENRGMYQCWYPLVSNITFTMCVCLYCYIQSTIQCHSVQQKSMHMQNSSWVKFPLLFGKKLKKTKQNNVIML